MEETLNALAGDSWDVYTYVLHCCLQFFSTFLYFISHLPFLYNQQELCCSGVCLLGQL